MDLINIGNKLRQLREQANLSAKDVSEILENTYGISMNYRTLFNYEKGRSSPDIDRFLTLCQIYNCNDILYEFGYTNIPKKSLISSDASEIYSKYCKLSKDGQNIIRNALGISENEMSEESTSFIPDTPEELESLYPPIEAPSEKKNIS